MGLLGNIQTVFSSTWGSASPEVGESLRVPLHPQNISFPVQGGIYQEDLRDEGKDAIEKCVLNYVWINQDYVCKPIASPWDAVSRDSLDTVFANAARYENVQFIIWVDCGVLNFDSSMGADSHAITTLPNVQMRNLRDILTHSEVPFFNPHYTPYIWARVDYAKLKVVEHTLEETDAEYVFFSDLDIERTCLAHNKVQTNLSQYGVIVGGNWIDPVENAYMGVRRGEGEEFFRALLKDTWYAVLEDGNGYYPMRRAVHHLAHKHGIENLCDLTIPVQDLSHLTFDPFA